MERKRITCPDSAHLEEVDVERTRFGLVVVGCSKFDSRSEVSCARECTRRLDRRERGDDAQDRVLIVYSRAPWTHPVAESLAELLRRDGFHVELADADTGTAPPPCDYEAVVVGSPERLGRRARSIVQYASRYRDELAAMPAVWFTVGSRDDANPARMHRATDWMPKHTVAILRPSWRVRWFGDPNAERAQQVRVLAEAIADEVPDREATQRP